MSMVDSWPAYVPDDEVPWNLRRVVHLHRRAGFGGTWTELTRDLADGPQKTIVRFLQGRAYISGVPEDFEAVSRVLAEAAVASSNPQRLKAWWLYRMIFSPDPLRERLALTWHNHFATSNAKVDSVEAMREQNETFRQSAKSTFGELLPQVVKAKAMLVWLDADKNRAGHPNENLGRELLELFTLGIGHYSEADVQQAARALTGCKVVGDQFRFDRAGHDDGDKTILGQTGTFAPDDLLKILAAQPATARRLAWRVCRMMLNEQSADPLAVDALAEGLREHKLEVGWAVETVIRSRRFFAEANLGACVASPPQYAVGAVRALEYFAHPPSTLLVAESVARMGQDLFYPPNVGGWPEGRAWLGSAAIIARTNFAAALVEGRLTSDGAPPDLLALAERNAGTSDLGGKIHWFGELLFGGLPHETVEMVRRAVTRAGDSQLAAAVVLLLSRPEAYLT